MNRQRILDIHTKLCADARALLERKGEAYASEDDALSNFQQSAERLNISPLKAVLLHKDKQDIALAHIADGATDTDGLHSRLLDIINYCVFALAVTLDKDDELVDYAVLYGQPPPGERKAALCLRGIATLNRSITNDQRA